MEAITKVPALSGRRNSKGRNSKSKKGCIQGQRAKGVSFSRKDRPHFLKQVIKPIGSLRVRVNQNEKGEFEDIESVDDIFLHLLPCIKKLASTYGVPFVAANHKLLSDDEKQMYLANSLDLIVKQTGIPQMGWNVEFNSKTKPVLVQYVKYDWDETLFSIPVENISKIKSIPLRNLIIDFMCYLRGTQELHNIKDGYYGMMIDTVKEDIEMLEHEGDCDEEDLQILIDRRKALEVFESGNAALYNDYLNGSVDHISLLHQLTTFRSRKHSKFLKHMIEGFHLLKSDSIIRYSEYQPDGNKYGNYPVRFIDMINIVWSWDDEPHAFMEQCLNDEAGENGISEPTLSNIVTRTECQILPHQNNYPNKFFSWLEYFITYLRETK